MAVGNFPKCLKVILKHEGGFVNHPSLAMVDKLPYKEGWSTQKNSLRKSILLSKWRVRHFIKKWLPRTLGHMPVVSMGVSMTHMPEVYAMRITLGSAREKTYPRHSGTEVKKINADNAIARLMAKVDGPSVKAITIKDAELSCDQFASMPSEGAVQDVVSLIHTMSTIFITLAAKGRILRLAMRSKVSAQKSSLLKSQSAFFYAQTATG